MEQSHEKQIAYCLVASLATPAAAWIGGLLVRLYYFDSGIFASQIFWHTVLCGYVAIGSFIASLVIYPISQRLIRRTRAPLALTGLLVLTLSILVAFFLLSYVGRTSPDQSGTALGWGFLISSMLLNFVCYSWLSNEMDPAL